MVLYPFSSESQDRRHYWLIITTVYSLVNANSKFQSESDELILYIALRHLAVILQIFYLAKYGLATLFVIKMFDDLLMTG